MSDSNTGTISGTLFEDADVDGVMDPKEKTTAPRKIVLKGPMGTSTTTSGDKGRYAFTGLAPGTYDLTREFPAGYRLSNNVLGYVRIQLAAGQTVSQDLGTTNQPLPPAGSISGRLFEDKNVDGQDNPGEAATGVRTVRIVSSDGKIIGNVDSDAAGNYAFTQLIAGTYHLTRDFPAGYRLSNNDQGYVAVTLAAGQDLTGVDLGTTNKPIKETSATDPVVVPAPPVVPVTPAQDYLFLICGLQVMKPETPVHSELWSGTKTALEVYKAVGVRGGREWNGFVGNPKTDTARLAWDRLKQYRDGGVGDHFIACLAHEDWTGLAMPTPDSTQASIKAWVKDVPTWAMGITDVEVGNEFAYVFDAKNPQADYWPGSVKDFVKNMLNPAYAVLHDAGFKVVLGGLNAYSPTQLQQVVDAGGKFDVIGHHPYAVDLNEYKTKTSELVRICPGVSIYETEEQTKDGPKVKADAAYVPKAVANWKTIDACRRTFPAVKIAAEYNAEYQTHSMTGPLGWFEMTRNGEKVITSAVTSPYFNARFADVFKAA